MEVLCFPFSPPDTTQGLTEGRLQEGAPPGSILQVCAVLFVPEPGGRCLQTAGQVQTIPFAVTRLGSADLISAERSFLETFHQEVQPSHPLRCAGRVWKGTAEGEEAGEH